VARRFTQQQAGSKRQPFPAHLPEIVITPSLAKPFAVACRELLWWFVVPEVGDRTMWATYGVPEGELTGVTELLARRPADIHGEKGVEIDVSNWDPKTGWTPSRMKIYGRLTRKTAEYLAVADTEGGTLRFRSFLDEGFERAWGPEPRRLRDRGRFVRQKDGSFRHKGDDPAAIGAGLFRLEVDGRDFACLRVLYVTERLPDEHATLVEAYLTKSGRTILQRHYCQKAGEVDRDQDRAPIVIDEVRFVAWYDCLSHIACGIKL